MPELPVADRTADAESTGQPVWADAIDVHHHAIPRFYDEALEVLGFATTLPGVERPHWDLEVSLEAMDAQGVRAALFSLWPGVPAAEREPAVALARRLNEYLADLVRDDPGRVGAFGVLPLPHVDSALEELDYALDVLGLDGVGMVTNVGGTYVGDTAFDPIWEELGRRGTPTFIHPTAAPSLAQQPSFGLPASLFEFPFETVRLAAQLLYNRTLDRYRGLRIILSHGGGGVPFLAERLTYGPIIDPGLEDQLSSDPIADLKRLYFDVAMTGNPYAMPSLRAFADPERVLVGTDLPFMPAWSSEDNARQLLSGGGLDDDGVARLTRRNAEALFPRFRYGPDDGGE